MQRSSVVVFLLVYISPSLSAPHEGLPLLNPGGIGGIFKGPNSETIIKGPDGSEITSEEQSGVIIRDDALAKKPIIVAEPEIPIAPAVPIVREENVYVAGPIVSSTALPILSSTPSFATLNQGYIPESRVIIPEAPLPPPPGPLLTGEAYGPEIYAPEVPLEVPLAPVELKPVEIIEQDPHIIETEIIPEPEGIQSEKEFNLKGPSGSITTKGSGSIVSGPASTTITEPRKIIIAPPKIVGTPVVATATIPLVKTPIEAPVFVSSPIPLPAESSVSVSTLAPPPGAISFEASTAAPPPRIQLSSTPGPSEYGSAIPGSPLTSGPLGFTERKEFIPVVEYNGVSGVIGGPLGVASSPQGVIYSSTVSTVTEKYAPLRGPAVPLPASYLLPPSVPVSSTPAPYLEAGPSTPSPYIQKVSKFQNTIAADGRVGELTQNEIISEEKKVFLPPNLAEARYIAPALEKNGINPQEVKYAQVPLSQVTKLPEGAYPYPQPYFEGGYELGTKKKRSN
ncbi:mucin-2-like isoform X2 [Sitophilus oryzae]|uniref:Mucin-2-like isoform X2 n=1 Tax=Sitophilus oryzae TaxID=7048 RepID=A0A6J2XGW2_SITOR|nr:mucin-2-like isoform X2 [Sitophilus oryzae]